MGWSGGSGLAAELWSAVRLHIPHDKREQVALKFMKAFEQEDCDTLDEATQLCRDAGQPKFSRKQCDKKCGADDGLCAYHAWSEKR